MDETELQCEKYSKNTAAATSYAQRLLEQFAVNNGADLLTMEISELDKLLRGFYSSLRKEDGEIWPVAFFVISATASRAI